MKTCFYIIFISLLVLPTLVFSQFTLHQPDGSNNGNYVTEVIVENNQVVFATRGDNILSVYDGSNWSYYDYQTYGFNGDTDISAVKELAVDPDGNYWIAYFSTIDKFDGTTATNYNTSNSELKNDIVRSMAIDAQGVTYFGYGSGGGISMLDNGIWTHRYDFTGGLDPLNSIFNADLMEYDAVNNAVWVSESNGSIFRIQNGVAEEYTWQDGIPSIGGDITDMAVTDDGKIWFSINDNNWNNGGILSFDGITWEHLTSANSDLPDEDISAIAAYGNNILVTGVQSRNISYYDGSTWTTFDETNSNYPEFGPQYFYEMKVWGNRAFACSSNGVVEFDLSITPVEIFTEELAISFGPNPVQDNLFIHTDLGIKKIDLFDATGRLVKSYSDVQNKIDVSQLPSGAYFIQAFFEHKNNRSFKIMKP